MLIKSVTLQNFRCHTQLKLDGFGKTNIIYGPNGAGKTSVLEAISLSAPGKGLRGASCEQFIKHEADNCGAFLELDGHIENVGIGYSKNKVKQVNIDSTRVKKTFRFTKAFSSALDNTRNGWIIERKQKRSEKTI